jgi:hypothetical protein
MKKIRINAFQTLKGFLNGQENDEEIYFAYSASLRIFGNDLNIDIVTKELGVEPTISYKKGDTKGKTVYKQDAWIYESQLADDVQIDKHINDLWIRFQDKIDYLKGLKDKFQVDIFLGYRSNCDHAGIEIAYDSLKIFNALEIPFGLSIIVG